MTFGADGRAKGQRHISIISHNSCPKQSSGVLASEAFDYTATAHMAAHLVA